MPSTFFDHDNPDVIRARTELERREEYIRHLEAQDTLGLLPSVLLQLLKQCLKNVPRQRPSIEDVLTILQCVREERVREFSINLITLDMARVKIIKDMKSQEKRIEQLTRQNVTLQANMVIIPVHIIHVIIQQEMQQLEIEEKGRELQVS